MTVFQFTSANGLSLLQRAISSPFLPLQIPLLLTSSASIFPPSLSHHQASTLSPAKRLSKHVSRISDTSLGISAALLERIRSSNRTFRTGQTSTEFIETILNYIINITIELQLIYKYATLNRFCLTIACSVSRI